MGILKELFDCFLPSHDAFIFMWILAAMGCVAFFICFERWFTIKKSTDYDAPRLFDKIRNLISGNNYDEACLICASGGVRALPRILEAGIRKAQSEPALIANVMGEETTHMSSLLERRLSYLAMFGNASTLLGLLGTVFGLIMSFAAVGKPGVDAVEKSSLLAAGISTAMNATLVGLLISVLCVVAYSFLRSKVDMALQEIDRYAIAILNLLNPPEDTKKSISTLSHRSRGEDEVADTDVTPMLNLMVMLIPFLLTSSEFVRIGALELKLPESAQESGSGGGNMEKQQDAKLELGIVINSKGFNLYSSFKSDMSSSETRAASGEKTPDIPLISGKYDFGTLNKKCAEIKRKVLMEILQAYSVPVSESMSLPDLYKLYTSKNISTSAYFADHENVKIVAEEKIKYQTVISVMDAARGIMTPQGNVTMFPNVSIAAGILQ